MQRTTAGALVTSALFLAGCGGAGTIAPTPANRTAPSSAARQFKSIGEAVAAGALRPVCPQAQRGRARCVSYVMTSAAGAATASQGTSRSVSSATLPPPDGFGPADLQSAYKLTAAARSNGNDELIAIVDAYDTPHAEKDLAAYRARYGLPACTTANHCFKKVNQRGKTAPLPPLAPPGYEGWQVETALDLDMVSANCPKCKILLVESDDDWMYNLGPAVNAAAELGAVAISNSYVTQESPDDQKPPGGPLGGTLAYYVHPNVAVIAGSGDNNYMYSGAAYGPLIPAAFPSVVAVGGTELTPDAATSRGWDETTWFATGSGCSAYEPMPPWQKADPNCVGSLTDSAGSVHSFPSRIYGDVAYVASGVAIYDSSGLFGPPGWIQAAGTSIGSPAIAAIYGLAGYGPNGNRNSDDGDFPAQKLYHSKRSLFDVTTGSNGSCTDAYLCNAGPGYDGPTGNGSPNGLGAF